VLIDRRQACLGAAAFFASLGAARPAFAAGCPAFETRTLEVPGETLARRCRLLVPRNGARPGRLLVLLHGLGETKNETLGIGAWAERYGVCEAYERLRKPPIRRTLADAVYLTDARLSELDRELERAPFRELAIACPFTPNVFRAGPTGAVLDRYAAWLVDGVLPALGRELGVREPKVGLDGVSLGGYAALEVFLRRPQAFASIGSLQGAISERAAEAFAARFERAFAASGRRPLRIATSSWDPGRAANERLVARLAKLDIHATLSVPPGPHDQRFLREAGSLELLLWHDRALRSCSESQNPSSCMP
jgi:pimeloyl-ACP methyl ester carboxylesterase